MIKLNASTSDRRYREVDPEIASGGVDTAIETRRSIRGFIDKPVPRATIERILAVASRAPSGTNIQPWKVHVVTGSAKERLSGEIISAYFSEAPHPKPEYQYYPSEWREPYLRRRRKIGWDLYSLLGIEKGDRAASRRQHARNFEFFGAPVGLIFTIDRDLPIGPWLDLGMFMQNIMIAARGRGLDTCPQAAFAWFHEIIRRQLRIPDIELVVCGMALGHADPNEPANRLVTEREPIAVFATFHET